MKKLNLLVFIIAGLIAFASCEEANVGPQLSTNIQPPSFSNTPSGEALVLDEENPDDVVLEMAWTKPGVGFNAPTTYTIEMAVAGSEFAEPAELGQTNVNSFSMTNSEMNAKMLGAGFTPEQPVDLDVRVKTEINDEIEVMFSEAFTFSVTPYNEDVSYPQIYVAGNFQSASGYTNDWSPADAPPLFSVNSNDVYEGYVYMVNGGNQFKFTAERNWDDGDWGDDGADGTLEPGSSNIELADAGYYKINVNLNNLEYSVTNTDWGIIGDATPGGWDNDTDMTYDPVTKVWSLDVNLTAGFIKFRANDGWDLNYGDDDPDGILELNGADISVAAAGSYTVELNLSEAPYTYTLTQN